MKEIILTNGYYTQVDDEDYVELSKHKWSAHGTHPHIYAVRVDTSNGGRVNLRMHRVITSAQKGFVVDHKDHNGLNNTRDNLRVCKQGDNCKNVSVHKNATSKYLGVYFDKVHRKYRAQIQINRKKIYMGLFKVEIDAAKAYDIKAKELFGEFANVNFK